MPFPIDEDFEADSDLRVLEEAREIRADSERLNRVRQRIEERRRELDETESRLNEPEVPAEGFIRLGELD